MLQSVISKPARRIAVLASACILATVGTLALIGTASADDSFGRRSCSNATLKGTYIWGTVAWSTAGASPAPFSQAGFNRFNGAGTGTFVVTAKGALNLDNARGPLTYTIKPDCTGTNEFNLFGTLLHDNVYLDASGESWSFVTTDSGFVVAGVKTRVSVP